MKNFKTQPGLLRVMVAQVPTRHLDSQAIFVHEEAGGPETWQANIFQPMHRVLGVLLAAHIAFFLFARPAPAQADEPDTENWNAKFQTTYIWQAHPSFPAQYTGSNSLSPNREKAYTWTGTAAFGFRPWKGGEFYVDPEMIQSTAFSGLHGLGGFPNAENQKGTSTTPVFYRARAFLRQTWGFGGGKEKIDSDMNQLAGSVDKRRLVLTAGNLSTTDIFDNNAYAHDPRTQFMNWSFLTYAASDYAADARGYTWGAALEYHDGGNWVYRAGRFIQPKESNGLALDPDIFRHYGDQVEVEHSHRIKGQSGKMRLYAFHNYANMGSFNDAIAYARANGGTPDVANVRHNQSKYGGGISVEQNLTDNIGVFGRASFNDGHTETYSFTEIDRSLTGGVSIKGAAWKRPNDTVGIAYARNGLSPSHRAYLAAGGQGAFLGDGALNYRTENIVEAYYSVNLNKHTWLSADYQHISNPGYNADRGPVDFYGARIHFEF